MGTIKSQVVGSRMCLKRSVSFGDCRQAELADIEAAAWQSPEEGSRDQLDIFALMHVYYCRENDLLKPANYRIGYEL